MNHAAPTPNEKTVTYRGFTIDASAIADSADYSATVESLKGQIDGVEAVMATEKAHAFFRAVPIVVEANKAALLYSGNKRQVILGAQRFDDRPILLHELLHAYHHQQLPGHNQNADVRRFYAAAKESGAFPAKAYMLTNSGEYFAMVGSVYLHGSAAREPFTRKQLCAKQRDVCEWLESVLVR
ncbi:MAG: hypothetical protein HY255_11645 [Betaproteobacteria bacterium]|nr:hypothetical protein [Betaproteobacteria bacterium]